MPQNGALSSPNLFAYTLPSSLLGEAAVHLGLTGPTFVINRPERPDLACLQVAWENVAWGECETMLTGTCDVQRPATYFCDHDAPPGAVFLLIQTAPRDGASGYGRIDMKQDGTLLLNEGPIDSLIDLVQACLDGRC